MADDPVVELGPLPFAELAAWLARAAVFAAPARYEPFGMAALEAARLLAERVPGLRTGAFHLVKRLPVAAGIGGGSYGSPGQSTDAVVPSLPSRLHVTVSPSPASAIFTDQVIAGASMSM